MQTWHDVIGAHKEADYFQRMMQYIASERAAGKEIYPTSEDVFNAFKATEFEQVKVVILGQDPYHGPGQAHGMSFSGQPGVKPPPSLVNIFKELEQDIEGFVRPVQGDLTQWAEQGVLLLNTVLTVEQGKAHSHAKIGWERFTDHVIEQLSQHREGIVFLLWGGHAQRKGERIDTQCHHVLMAPHPSPLSAHRGFLGCGHFSQANNLLAQQGQQAINWRLDP